jgi:hypothetical protein
VDKMSLNEILIILIILFILPSIAKSEESIDVYALNGSINRIYGINVSNYKPTKNTFSSLLYFNGSEYKGQASFYTSGYLTNVRKQPVSIGLIMNNVTNCTSFNSTIDCYGYGRMVFMNPKIMSVTVNYSVHIFGGKIDISGRNISNDLFNITGMEIKKFSPGFVVINNDSALEVTWMNTNQTILNPPINFTNILNFPPGPIGNTTYAKNNVFLKNVGNTSIKIYVCGENYPGTVEFYIKSGTRISGLQTLPVCDYSQSFSNGIQIVPNFYGNISLPIGKEIEIYNSRITYTQNYTVGSLNFNITVA